MPGTESAREFGDELRRERELRDVSREQLAEATKVSLRHIEAIESGRFERLPSPVFSKGFVRVIALHLGLDEERSVAAFRHVYESWEKGKEKAAGAETATARVRLSKPRRAVSSSTTVRAIGIALLLATITGGAAFFRTRGSTRRVLINGYPRAYSRGVEEAIACVQVLALAGRRLGRAGKSEGRYEAKTDCANDNSDKRRSVIGPRWFPVVGTR